MGFVVRRAVLGDADAVLGVNLRAIGETARGHAGYDDHQIETWLGGLSVERVRDLIGSTVFLVAESAGTIAGFVNLVVASGEIDLLFVHPDFGRRGVGRMLVTAIEGEARSTEVRRLRVDASLLAAPLFEKLGYGVELRYTKSHDGAEFPNTWLTKPLDHLDRPTAE